MRLESLHSFVTLVKLGSYAAAAASLYLSPTTLHGHVRALEEDAGATLVVFNGRKLELTQAGSRLLVFAERVLAEQSQLQRELAQITRQGRAELRLASLHGPSTHLLPPVVRAFQALRPDVQVSVRAGGVGESIAALLAGEVSLAILNESHADVAAGNYTATPLYEDELVLVVRREDCTLPDRELVELYPMAAQPPLSSYRQYVERWARSEHIALNFVYEHTSFDGIIAYVMSGHCVGMVGRYVVEMSPLKDDLRILDLPSLSMKKMLYGLHASQPDALTTAFNSFFREFYMADQPSAEPKIALIPSIRLSRR